MKVDYVYPNNNEEEFIEVGKYLGLGKIVFVYKDKAPKNMLPSKIKSDILPEIIIDIAIESDEKVIKTNYPLIVRTYSKVREMINNPKVYGVIGQELNPRKDLVHHRNSGLNHIICKLAHEKKKTIFFSFNDMLSYKSSKIYGRMKQNFKLCKKYNVEIILASFAKKPSEMRRSEDIKLLIK